MRRMWLLPLALTLPLCCTAGCPAAQGPPEARRPAQEPGPPPLPVEHRALTLRMGIPELSLERGDLPPFSRFLDPSPLPPRSLRQERELSFRAEGRERQEVLTDLAARLWALANVKMDRVRALLKNTRRASKASTAKKVKALRQEISAHLQESVVLLQGVLETPDPPRLARLRLAHYLRELKPQSATSHLRALLVDAPEGPAREAMALDLAQLLLLGGDAFQASEVFHSLLKTVSTPRGRLLRALAHAATLHGLREEAVKAALSDCAGTGGVAALAPRVHLPVLLASLRRPAKAFEGLLVQGSACVREEGSTVGAHLVERLLDLGRASAARSVRRVMGRASLELPGPLKLRVTQEAGPFPVSEKPPPDALLTQLLRGHVGAVLACAGRGVPQGGLRLMLRVLQGGQVGLVFPPAVSSSRPGEAVGPAVGAHQESTPLWRCLGDLVPRWRLPPWRAQVNLELTVTVKVTRSGRRQNPETDPG